MHDEPRQPTEEELQAAFEEQMRNVRVDDVVLQTVATLVNLAGRRLGLAGAEDEKDLEQAKLGIDAARALVPMCPEEQLGPIKQAMSQLQMAYAREAQPAAEPAAEPGVEQPAASEEERAKARSKIWTPPGA